MTPEERIDRIERDFDEMRALLKESLKRHEDFRQNHESWLLDIQQAIREQDAERAAAEDKHAFEMAEVRSLLRELSAAQVITEERLQRLIRALNGSHGGDGRGSQ